MPMYSTRYTVYRHRPPSSWTIFWLVMLVLFFIGLLVKLWPAVLACLVAWGTYRVVYRRRRAVELERARLLHTADAEHGLFMRGYDAGVYGRFDPGPIGREWLTPDEWEQRHKG